MSTQNFQRALSSTMFESEEKKLISQIIKQQIQNAVEASYVQMLSHQKTISNQKHNYGYVIQSDCTNFDVQENNNHPSELSEKEQAA